MIHKIYDTILYTLKEKKHWDPTKNPIASGDLSRRKLLPQAAWHADWHHIHLIGIGGVGMSGLAHLYHQQGFRVTGSDLARNSYTKKLEALGISVFMGHHADHSTGADCVIVSSAVQPTNPELVAAKTAGCPVIKRGDALAHIMTHYPHRWVVAGTHGKTTTSTLWVHALTQIGQPPSYAIGATVLHSGTNAHTQSTTHFVAESDESDGSFLALSPTVAIITNIEHEHVDFYPTISELVASFRVFIATVLDAGGWVIANYDDPILAQALPTQSDRIITYGTHPNATVFATDIDTTPTGCHYTLNTPNGVVKQIELPMLGDHNISNSLGVMAALYQADLPVPPTVFSGFKGASRRFEPIGTHNAIQIIDDYAHHPTEIKTVLAGMKALNAARIVCVFQPHRLSRVAALVTDFSNCFNDADWLIVTPIYTANEPPKNSDAIRQELLINIQRHSTATVQYESDLNALADKVAPALRPGDVVITLGAGNISRVAHALLHAITHDTCVVQNV